MIYIDANVIYNYIVQTELTEYAKSVFGQQEPLVTSWTALNEATYTLFRKIAKERGFRTIYDIKKMSMEERTEMLMVAYDAVRLLISERNVQTLQEHHDIRIIREVSRRYGLLPSDAVIAATAMEHGVEKLATFDTDFTAVSKVFDLVPEEYWKELQK
ncbi:PIN domain-containing protein [Thermococcus stetteri]|uniref:PIN domain-containing protein n=1 Tax=Thermococcus stetteri TaxID=49900 RepID=UPI001AE8EE6A|nr:PIN domain-containing protein [Thermococcus stetteri]MBP1910808.1 putative nucleic acid-binding protein [Thermococcus stetteri]